jgi:hypothetical protein
MRPLFWLIILLVLPFLIDTAGNALDAARRPRRQSRHGL